MWSIIGELCTTVVVACVSYPANGQMFETERRCRQAVVEAFEQRGSFEPYVSVSCRYRPKRPLRRIE